MVDPSPHAVVPPPTSTSEGLFAPIPQQYKEALDCAAALFSSLITSASRHKDPVDRRDGVMMWKVDDTTDDEPGIMPFTCNEAMLRSATPLEILSTITLEGECFGQCSGAAAAFWRC